MAELRGAVALVTGGGRGIGAAIVRRLDAAGAQVALHYQNSEAPAAAVAGACGGRVRLFRADLTGAEAPAALLRSVEAACGPVAYLVNNAALTPHPSPESGFEPELAERVFNVNLRAPMALALAGSNLVSIVNIGSANTGRGEGSTLYFAVTKGAVPTLTYALARRLAPRVRVNAVLPGLTDTEEIAGRGPGFEPTRLDMVRRTPLQRMGRPDEIAEVVEFLLARNSFITGSVLSVDGGLYL